MHPNTLFLLDLLALYVERQLTSACGEPTIGLTVLVCSQTTNPSATSCQSRSSATFEEGRLAVEGWVPVSKVRSCLPCWSISLI
jgi:hypothetical protein